MTDKFVERAIDLREKAIEKRSLLRGQEAYQKSGFNKEDATTAFWVAADYRNSMIEIAHLIDNAQYSDKMYSRQNIIDRLTEIFEMYESQHSI